MSSLFLVWSYKCREKEREHEVKKWILEVFQPYLKVIPYFKSAKTYMRRLGLGQISTFHTWIEISNFSTLDKWVEHIQTKDWKEMGKTFFGLTKDFNSSIVYELV